MSDKHWLKKLNLKNLNRLHFFNTYLSKRNLLKISLSINDYEEPGFTRRKNLNHNSLSHQAVISIERYFNNEFPTDEARLERAIYLDEIYASSTISENYFNWIDQDNPRQCYFVWSVARLTTFSLYDKDQLSAKDFIVDTKPLRLKRFRTDYTKYNLLTQNPCNSLDCKENLVSFIHIWDKTLEFKIEYMECLKEKWKEVNQFNHKIFKHLSQDNTEHTKWFWNYLLDNTETPHSFLSPMADSEYLPCARAIFDIWPESSAEKTLILNKAYNAFHSKKFKLKPEREKGANIWLGADEMNQLLEISNKKGISPKLTLKRLINLEFAKISK